MCYSAMLEQRIKALGVTYQARIQYDDFEVLFRLRLDEPSVLVSRALEDQFMNPESSQEQRILASILEYRHRRAQELQRGLAEQEERLRAAERRLALRTTRTASKEASVARRRVAWHEEKLADLLRSDSRSSDSRIFPFWYAPVVVSNQGQLAVRPLRYHLRPSGRPATIDRKYPGLYNARRDSLTGFWREQFGKHHAICVVARFFENVPTHRYQHRLLAPGEHPRNLVVSYRPRDESLLAVACLWDEWRAPNQNGFASFAMVTDHPPPDVAATGHDRCIVALQQEAVSHWLHPARSDLRALDGLLDRRHATAFNHQAQNDREPADSGKPETLFNRDSGRS